MKNFPAPEIDKIAKAYKAAGYDGNIEQCQAQMLKDHAQFIEDLNKFKNFLGSRSTKSKLLSALKSRYNPKSLLTPIRQAEHKARSDSNIRVVEDDKFSKLQSAIKNNKAKIPKEIQPEFDRINTYLKKFTIINEAYPQHNLNKQLSGAVFVYRTN